MINEDFEQLLKDYGKQIGVFSYNNQEYRYI